MNKTIRYILYFVIIAICIMAVFIGVYNLELAQNNQHSEIINQTPEENGTNTKENIVEKFNKLFTNEFLSTNYNDSKIEKLDASKPLVYSESQVANKDGQYKIDAYLPIINIKSEVAQKFNSETIENFGNRANTLMSSQNLAQFTIYETSYTSYVNNNILSVAIKASIKEGSNAQRVIIKSYNYNLDTGKAVTISDILKTKGFEEETVNKKIQSEINEASDNSKTVAQSGYEIYKRNAGDQMYDVKNVDNFILGPNGILYIVYAYGNSTNTSEMDVIEVGYE